VRIAGTTVASAIATMTTAIIYPSGGASGGATRHPDSSPRGRPHGVSS
jgi:hypothetical protein